MAFKDKLPKVSRRQAIAIAKGNTGVLTYTLVFVLIFLHDFSLLVDYPIVLTSMVVVAIAGSPGNSVGAVLDGAFLGGLGVAVGALFFFILAKLGSSRVAQGFVWFVMVYALALVKAQSMRYFAFSLLGLLVAFSGIYTSVLLGGRFQPEYLESYLIAYAWAFALVLFVAIAIFPVSAERELRELLVQSLERVSMFTHLIAKTYSLEISDEERKVRDALGQSIRADFVFSQTKMSQARMELVAFSRNSMSDYARILGRLRQMQQGLITCNSSLVVMERLEPASLELIEHQLTATSTGRSFAKLRQGFDLGVSDIVKELAVGDKSYHSPAPEAWGSWEDFLEQEGPSDTEAGRKRSPSVSPASPELQQRLVLVSEKLREEVRHITASPAASRRPSFSGGHKSEQSEHEEGTTAVPSKVASRKAVDLSSFDRVAFLRTCWTRFKTDQNESITNLLASGITEDDVLRVTSPAPSLHEQFGKPGVTSALASGLSDGVSQPVRRTAQHSLDGADKDAATATQAEEANGRSNRLELSERVCGTSVLRTMSFLFAMGQVVEELANLHDEVVPHTDEARRKKKIHIHCLEKLPKPPKGTGLPLREALSRLSTQHDFSEKPVSLWQRIGQLERLARSPTSIYAFKTACAVSVYTVFLLAPSLTSFFVDYALTGGVISIIVGISTSVGQSLVTFVLQILGTGFGSLYGLLILRIAQRSGGPAGVEFSPYILAVLLAIGAIPACAIIYLRPMFFAGALLFLNGAGILVITEYTYTSTPGQIRPGFDSPAYRTGKAFVALSLALAIASVFQFFLLRTPARHTLRKNLAAITFSLSSYSVLFSFLVEAFHPLEVDLDPSRPPPDPEATATIRQELIRREGQIQGELLALMPLMKFSAAEPAFGVPFQAATISQLIRSHQVVLDRLREARTAFGENGFPDENIRSGFMTTLTPYRRQARRFTRALFYLISTSLSTKASLPHELPSLMSASRNLQHDAFVLTGRLSRTPKGAELLKSTNSDFLRYWFYVTASVGVAYNLESMEPDMRVLFGEIEDKWI